ncbi:MAG: universal stress protein, partial [Gordonia sp. (in: high G+C Gram-positive bacteria)]|uniref:universal stress protein n=1 Tax=Gordonia sp. (in: high G+C Gram-positive bacteria) TaxID=84139 RepID=UPI003BB7A9FC
MTHFGRFVGISSGRLRVHTMTTSLGPIIAAVDGSGPALDAVRWAARAAAAQHRPLRVISVIEPPALAYGNGIP